MDAAMPSLRALPALASLTLTACAAQVPWPPPSGSCIEAYRRPVRRAPTRYWIAGVPVTREEVEHVVYVTPALREKAHHDGVMVWVGSAMLVTGSTTELAGFVATGVTGRLPLVGIIGAGLVTALAGFIVLVRRRDPFQEGVVAFNAEARRRGYCVDPGRPFPLPRAQPPASLPEPSPRNAPPVGLPELPTRGWTP